MFSLQKSVFSFFHFYRKNSCLIQYIVQVAALISDGKKFLSKSMMGNNPAGNPLGHVSTDVGSTSGDTGWPPAGRK